MKNLVETLINESSARRNTLNRLFTKFVNEIYNDDNELVISNKKVAEIWDDGTIVFPEDFNETLANFIRDCYIYKHNDWEVESEDYPVSIGEPK